MQIIRRGVLTMTGAIGGGVALSSLGLNLNPAQAYAAEVPGEALPIGEIEIKIMAAVKKLYEKEGGPNAEAIVNLKWDYLNKQRHFDAIKVAQHINGVFLEDTVIEDKAKGAKTEFKKGQLVPGFGNLQLDGKMACGNWCISGSYTADGSNKMASRGKEDPTGLGLFPNWAFAWPVGRRFLLIAVFLNLFCMLTHSIFTVKF